jgi:hypothetical protein
VMQKNKNLSQLVPIDLLPISTQGPEFVAIPCCTNTGDFVGF